MVGLLLKLGNTLQPAQLSSQQLHSCTPYAIHTMSIPHHGHKINIAALLVVACCLPSHLSCISSRSTGRRSLGWST